MMANVGGIALESKQRIEIGRLGAYDSANQDSGVQRRVSCNNRVYRG